MKKQFLFCMFLASGHALTAQTAYLNKVLEYCPAPGQFVHELPAYEEGDNAEAMASKCLENLYDERLVSLGAYGGYITVGFDHKILNITGEKDLLIYGNANKYNTSAEPGIVMVSEDTNGNGLPDDEWYELAGSEYGSEATVHDYEITYTRPEQEDMDVPWTDNQGGSGVVKYMGLVAGTYSHEHAHYPAWIESNTLTFKGSRLADNGAYDTEARMWIMSPYEYGYADNKASKEECSFDIDWAVDSQGEKVHLSGIDFVRIYTAVNQQIGGGVGEISTEVADVQDLHPYATSIQESSHEIRICYQPGRLIVEGIGNAPVSVYDLRGILLGRWTRPEGNGYPIRLSPGIFLIQAGSHQYKLYIGE